MLNEVLISVGFVSLKSDMCVFKKDVEGVSSMFIVVVWVDDLLSIIIQRASRNLMSIG